MSENSAAQNYQLNFERELQELEAQLNDLLAQCEHLQEENDSLKRRQESLITCLLYTSPSPRDGLLSRMPSSA